MRRILCCLLGVFILSIGFAEAQDFTIEINRGQGDALTLVTPKTSSNGQALIWAFEQHNIDLVVAEESPLADEPTYLRDVILLPALRSWRRQQLREGVQAAFDEAAEVTRENVRILLGL